MHSRLKHIISVEYGPTEYRGLSIQLMDDRLFK